MDYNNAYEQEIDLKDLIFAVLHRWRMIFGAAVVLALLLGGYKALRTYTGGNDESAVLEAKAQYEKELEAYNQRVSACEREIANLEEDISRQEEYLENSILMNMSPYDVWEGKTELFVKTDYTIMPELTYQNQDFTATVLQSYQSALTNAEFIKDVAAKEQIDARYLKELVTVTVGKSDNGYNNLLIVQVRHTDEKMADELMKDILNGVKQSEGRIQSVIGTHTITEVNRSLGSLVDLTLADRQRNEREQLALLTDSLVEKNTNLETMNQEEMPKPVDASSRSTVKSGIKYGVLGGVLGAFAVMFFVCVTFLMSDKVYSAKELKSRFKLKLLGILPADETKKKNPLDLWLNRLEGHSGSKDMEREYDLIATNVFHYAGEISSLLITGGAREDKIASVAEKLSERLPNIKIVSGGSFLLEPRSLKGLSECDGVLLVEQKGVSSYSAAEQELEKIEDLHKNMVGCVVFE